MTDHDGDSQMQSSSSASASDSEMFPAPKDSSGQPATNGPIRSDGMPLPAQQARADVDVHVAADPDVMDVGGEMGIGADAGANGVLVNAYGGETEGSGKVEEAPGWTWTNAKAREELERSLDVVLDRNFSMKEFGELFDEQTIAALAGAEKVGTA